MDALFVLIVAGVVLLTYGLVTYSLYIARVLEIFIFEKIRSLFKKKGVKK